MTLLDAFEANLLDIQSCFGQERVFKRAHALAYASLFTYGRHTISRMICSKNQHHLDWSADYRLFSKRSWDADDLFFEILKKSARHSHWPNNDIVVALDDTAVHKTGKKIPGVCTLRDPMSLPFHTNLIPGIRFLQGSILVNPDKRVECYRAIPVFFEEASPAKRPKKNATAEDHRLFKEEQKVKRISVLGQYATRKIRAQINRLPNGAKRTLFMTVDGSFCNKNYMRHLPQNVVPIARGRKDMKLFRPAGSSARANRIYGEQLPTPEEMRRDDTFAWLKAKPFFARKHHEIRYKVIEPVLWQTGTLGQKLRLIIIAPLGYRLTKNSKKLYRKPAYLITPDLETPVEQLLQYYFLRWDIEVNNRDEKSLLGVGDAQVRAPKSVKRNPQFMVIAYSLLILASMQAYGPERTDDYLLQPKWRRKKNRRPSALDIIAQFRYEVAQRQLGAELTELIALKNARKKVRKKSKTTGFVPPAAAVQTPCDLPVNIFSALFYADA